MSMASRGASLLVVSDMHLTEEQPPRGLWKRFLQRDRFVDDDFAALLRHTREKEAGPLCLVLNGDVFDFDAVMSVPETAEDLGYLERTRSLDPTEPKSVYKMECIIRDHPVFFDALVELLQAGHRLVIVLGNHDVELFWPAVQAVVRQRLGPAASSEAVRFEPWAYEWADVRIEHGHLLDPFCAVEDPTHPVLEAPEGVRQVQVPFGNLVNRYLANLMGFFNPNCTESYQHSAWGYFVFWLKHHLRKKIPLARVWFWGALFTLWQAARQRRWRPLRRRQALPGPYERPAFRRWFLMLRELWLDRVALVGAGAVTIVIVALALGAGWWLAPSISGVIAGAVVWDRIIRRYVPRSDVWLHRLQEGAAKLARATGARLLVLGHSHSWQKQPLPDGGYYLNSGTFSPSYLDVECEQPKPFSRTFLWLPSEGEPLVMEWRNSAPVRVA